jgi:hypothetical protein
VVELRRREQNTQSLRLGELSRQEMQQRAPSHDSFFSLKGADLRPGSVATEFVDTDWEEDGIISDLEDDESNSPRTSLNSVSRHVTLGVRKRAC